MRTVVLLAAALTLLPVPGSGQASVDQAIAAFDRAWRSGDVNTIGNLMAEEGIGLQLGNESHSLVGGRQARAALTEFRGSRSAGTLELQQSGQLSGDPSKGMAEFRWQSVVRGTSEEVRYTVFVQFTRTPSAWRISAIRVF